MSRALKGLVALVVSAALLCLLVGDWSVPVLNQARFRDALIAFAILSFLSEASYIKLRIGKATTDSSVVFIPFIASTLLFGSSWAMLVACGVVVLAEHFVRHKAAVKVIFNVSQHGLSVWAAASAFTLLGGIPAFTASAVSDALHFDPRPIPIIAAIAAYFLVNITAVSLAVTLSDRIPLKESWFRVGGSSILYDLISSPLAVLLAFLYVKAGMLGVVAIVLPLYFVRHTYSANVQLEEANRELLELMVKAIEARDPYTSGHSQRVSEIAGLLARDLALGTKLVEQVKTAALLHDVGKIYEVYAPLLRKEGKLDATEKALMQTHSLRSAELAGTISAFRGTIVDAIRHHHENYDGSGYPTGLAGKAIPVGARIIMIADTVDAMTTDRPYRGALTFERVAQELARYSGKQFDPQLVVTFMESVSIRSLLQQRGGASTTPAQQMAHARWGRGTGNMVATT